MNTIEILSESIVLASADAGSAEPVWREAAAFTQTVRGRMVFCLIGVADLCQAGMNRWAALLEELDAKYEPSQFGWRTAPATSSC